MFRVRVTRPRVTALPKRVNLSMAIIKTQNLTKKFKSLVAVDNVSLEIAEGECFGLLGPNGAGKTTLIRMITAVSPPTAGILQVLDKDLKAHAQEIKAVLGVG